MITSATVPVTVSPEAVARIAELRLQTEVDQVVEHARQWLPDLECIALNVYDRYELGNEPGLSIDLYGRRPYDRDNRPEQGLVRWLVTTFPPEVLQSIIVDYHPGQGHAG